MPRNGSGTYSLPESAFQPNTPIQSSAVNSDFSDIASALTASVAADGQTPVTAPIKFANGSAALPSLTFVSDPNTGIYRTGSDAVGIATGGTKIAEVTSAGLAITGTLTVTGTGWVGTTAIVDKAVTYAKIQDITASSRLLGRATSGAGVTEEITIGQGLVLSSTTLTAPAFPPPAAFSQLSIKVATTTTIAVSAAFVTVTDGTNYLSVPISATCNLGTAGVVNGLDAGAIATSTFYYMYAISTGSSHGTLASTSPTSPTLPSGYTYKARIGAVLTASGVAQLFGTWQIGKRAQYIVGLAQTSTARRAANGVQGNISTPTWAAISLANFVPPTASRVTVAVNGYAAGDQVIVAPNNSYGSSSSTTNAAPIILGNGTGSAQVSIMGELLLESGSIYWASTGANDAVYINGWEDNL